MKNQENLHSANLPARRYDLDWLRVIAFAILIFFHVGMFFNFWEWHIKNDVITHAIELPMRFTSQWRMSLLFMISGAGMYFALGSRGPKAFLSERFVRIFIPLVFGIFVIVPPQIFLERLTQGETYSYGEFYKTIFDFTPYPAGSFSWHHLWYLVYIFLYSIIGLPLLLFIRRHNQLTASWVRLFGNPFTLILVPVLWHMLGNVLLGHFPTTHNLIRDWNEHFHDFTLFVTGFVLCTQTGFWETLKKYRKVNLVIWLIFTAILYAFYWIPRAEIEGGEIIFYNLLKTLNAWCILLSIFGYAYVYLQFSNRFLKYANEAVYPFYILHQTVIVCLAYPLINTALPWIVKFIYLSVATFLICLVIYHFLIKQLNILRIVFGLKRKKESTVKRSEEAVISLRS
ncbi:acyltransferase [Dyadobacter chenwenxiniae]|uniref:Acyltransferase n=1 Tax=Dyadobacter chenwenxiniae TaxID=2906456 RepID=A0A9X1TEB4_9BACT|nr:acyltransferase [Dyadobacter chenwenxiniae]MCF0061917.1 acyltransferase [Dyadobacter chenwenxiniae]UON81731.1 acyltransferase [Dyadobacter chenwenxiniae]